MSSVDELARLLGSGRYSQRRLADGSGVLLDTRDMRVFSLNSTGMVVLDSIAAGETRLERLVACLTAAFEVDESTAAEDLDDLLGELDRILATAGDP